MNFKKHISLGLFLVFVFQGIADAAPITSLPAVRTSIGITKAAGLPKPIIPNVQAPRSFPEPFRKPLGTSGAVQATKLVPIRWKAIAAGVAVAAGLLFFPLKQNDAKESELRYARPELFQPRKPRQKGFAVVGPTTGDHFYDQLRESERMRIQPSHTQSQTHGRVVNQQGNLANSNTQNVVREKQLIWEEYLEMIHSQLGTIKLMFFKLKGLDVDEYFQQMSQIERTWHLLLTNRLED